MKQIIALYMPRKYVLVSTYEFLDLIIAIESSKGIMVSLNAESTFTNVTAEDTIQIVMDKVYDNNEYDRPLPRGKAEQQTCLQL